jgi:electron transfer flavoprotein beta subunit
MKIAVLVKQVPDTWGERRIDQTSGRVDRSDGDQVIDEIDERALEIALVQRDGNRDSQVVAITMGPAAAGDAVRKSLTIGADSGVHILDDSLVGADAATTAAQLAAAIQAGGFDLVIGGNVSTDGRGGVVPAMISERLGLPLLSALDVVELASDTVSGSRTTDFGVQTVSAALPAVITVTERVPEARFPSFKNIMAAKKKPVTVLAAAQLTAPRPSARSVVLAVRERPRREAGRIVIDDGNAAAELAEFLIAEHLV